MYSCVQASDERCRMYHSQNMDMLQYLQNGNTQFLRFSIYNNLSHVIIYTLFRNYLPPKTKPQRLVYSINKHISIQLHISIVYISDNQAKKTLSGTTGVRYPLLGVPPGVIFDSALIKLPMPLWQVNSLDLRQDAWGSYCPRQTSSREMLQYALQQESSYGCYCSY